MRTIEVDPAIFAQALLDSGRCPDLASAQLAGARIADRIKRGLDGIPPAQGLADVARLVAAREGIPLDEAQRKVMRTFAKNMPQPIAPRREGESVKAYAERVRTQEVTNVARFTEQSRLQAAQLRREKFDPTKIQTEITTTLTRFGLPLDLANLIASDAVEKTRSTQATTETEKELEVTAKKTLRMRSELKKGNR
jgi:hypothetical protein